MYREMADADGAGPNGETGGAGQTGGHHSGAVGWRTRLATCFAPVCVVSALVGMYFDPAEASKQGAHLATFLVFCCGVLGAFGSRLLRARRRAMSVGSVFGGGVFLGAGLIHLLPDAADDLAERFPDYPVANAVCVAGILLTMVVEESTLALKSWAGKRAEALAEAEAEEQTRSPGRPMLNSRGSNGSLNGLEQRSSGGGGHSTGFSRARGVSISEELAAAAADRDDGDGDGEHGHGGLPSVGGGGLSVFWILCIGLSFHSFMAGD
jgi:zinc transporter ZupT